MTGTVLDDIPLGNALLSSVLLWGAFRLAVALVEARSSNRRADRTDSRHGELLHHLVAVAEVSRDLLATLELLAADVAAIRNAVEAEDGAR